ncbi:hypothetical protein INR49_022691, partial [Caranx melampygus]
HRSGGAALTTEGLTPLAHPLGAADAAWVTSSRLQQPASRAEDPALHSARTYQKLYGKPCGNIRFGPSKLWTFGADVLGACLLQHTFLWIRNHRQQLHLQQRKETDAHEPSPLPSCALFLNTASRLSFV